MSDAGARDGEADPALADTAADAARGAEQPLRPGDKLGRYTILDVMGVGGMGVVHAAHDADLDRRVAVKLLRTASHAERGRARLLREARAMARLRHPNVIKVYDAGTVGKRVFVAMELVEGLTGAEWLAAPDTRRDWREVLRVFVAAGQGLAAAHAAGLVHRDFKPSNVLVDRSGRVVVTDFGLARQTRTDSSSTTRDTTGSISMSGSGSTSRSGSGAGAGAAEAAEAADAADAAEAADAADAADMADMMADLAAAGVAGGDAPELTLTRPGAILGTPAYMAPEQHRGSPADARSDQFSFCVALYEGLYGQRPFRGHSSASLHAAIVQGRIAEPPRGSRVPRRLRRLLLRGLRAEPGERFPSMDALLAALGNVARPRPRSLLAGAAALLVSLGAFVLVVGARPADAPAADCAISLDGVWDDGVAAAVRAVLSRTADGGAAFSALAARLDAGRHAWHEARTLVCEGARADLWTFHRRMGCLLDYRDQVATLTELVRAADTQAMDFAVSAAADLPDPAHCAALAHGPQATLEVLDEPVRTAESERLRTALAQAKTAYEMAKFDRAIELAEVVLAGARALGERHLQGWALHRLGATYSLKDDGATARRFLREAITLAEELDDARLLAESLVAHASLDVGEGKSDERAVREIVSRARAAVRRLSDPGHLAGWIRLIEAYDHAANNYLAEAEAAFAEAHRGYLDAGLELRAARVDLYQGLFLHGNGRPQEGAVLMERGLSVMRAQLSAMSYDMICKLDLASRAAESLERYEEARQFYEITNRRCQDRRRPPAADAASVRGHVVDDAGQPAAGVEVVAHPGLLGNGRYPINSGDRWRAFVTRTDAGGRFAMPAGSSEQPVVVVAEGHRGRSFPVVVAPGAAGKDLVLTLRPFGSVRGQLEAPWVSAGALALALVPVAEAPVHHGSIEVPVRSNGSFAVERLAAGRYRVGVVQRDPRSQPMRTTRWLPLRGPGGEIVVEAGRATVLPLALPGDTVSGPAVAPGGPGALEIHVHNRFEGSIPRAHLLLFAGRAVPASMAELDARWSEAASARFFAEASPEADHPGTEDTGHAALWHRFTGLPGGDLVACAVPLSESASYQPELGYPPFLDVYCVAVDQAERALARPIVIDAAPARRRS
jgi:serine/threonine protein kinase